VIFILVIVTFFTLLTEFVKFLTEFVELFTEFFTLLTEFVMLFTVYTLYLEKIDFFFFRALTLYGFYVGPALSAVRPVCSHGRPSRGTSGSELLRATL
jgi:hypothetical protein